jgi:hypothetical protein
MAHLDALGPLVGNARSFRCGGNARRRPQIGSQGFLVGDQRLAGVGCGDFHHLLGRAHRDNFTSRLSAFRAEVDQPVRCADHVEVVLDHDDRVSGRDELAERSEELGDVLEVQAGGGLVEEEEARLLACAFLRAARQHRDRAAIGLGEVAGELEALRFPAGEGRHGLAELEVIEAHFRQRPQAAHDFRLGIECVHRLGNREIEDVRNAAAIDLHFEHFLAIARAVAIRAAQVHVREELHLDMLEAVAAAGGAAPVARVEAESARGVGACPGVRGRREQVADRVEGAHVARRIGARGAADGRLVDEHDVVHVLGADQLAECAGRFRRLAEVLAQRGMQDVLYQRGLARARHSRHAHQAAQREVDVDVLQVVLGGAANAERHRAVEGVAREVVGHLHARNAHLLVVAAVVGALAPGKIFGGQGLRTFQILGRAEEDDLAAALARTRTHVEEAIGFEHDLRIVLDHHERIARVAQALHHVDHAAHVARMQADGGLVEDEERIDERGAERRGEVDALHFAARERARLAIEREVAQSHLPQVAQARTDLGHQQLRRFVERLGQVELAEGLAQAVHGDQHHVVHRHALDLPQQRFGLEARALAGGAGRVGAVARQQHAHVHLVRLGLEPVEEARDAVPMGLARLVPVHPARVAVDHPAPILLGQVAPRDVERHAALLRVPGEIVLAFVEALRLEDLHRPLAQGFRRVGNHQPIVHADDAPESAARVARADGRIEREARGRRIRVVDVAGSAVKISGEPPRRFRSR